MMALTRKEEGEEREGGGGEGEEGEGEGGESVRMLEMIEIDKRKTQALNGEWVALCVGVYMSC